MRTADGATRGAAGGGTPSCAASRSVCRKAGSKGRETGPPATVVLGCDRGGLYTELESGR